MNRDGPGGGGGGGGGSGGGGSLLSAEVAQSAVKTIADVAGSLLEFVEDAAERSRSADSYRTAGDGDLRPFTSHVKPFTRVVWLSNLSPPMIDPTRTYVPRATCHVYIPPPLSASS